jgi:chaperonin GroES
MLQQLTSKYWQSPGESANIVQANLYRSSVHHSIAKSKEVSGMNIRPLYDRIVVKRIEDQETKIGGLYIPDSAKEKPQEGEVVAVGKGKRLEDGKVVPLDVQKGDRILFGKYSGSEIRIDGEELMIMREDEVLGVLEGAGKKASKVA